MIDKLDAGKARFDLIEPAWIKSVAEVLTLGAAKYAPENWKVIDDAKNRYIAAAHRHLNAYQLGEIDDPESGLPHLSHASCCLMFLHWIDANL